MDASLHGCGRSPPGPAPFPPPPARRPHLDAAALQGAAGLHLEAARRAGGQVQRRRHVGGLGGGHQVHLVAHEQQRHTLQAGRRE